MDEILTHPVQVNRSTKTGRAPVAVTMAAYEVYAAVCGEQKAMITDNCRGGFGTGELIAFLYAKAFPKSEWRTRVDEALTGMEGI